MKIAAVLTAAAATTTVASGNLLRDPKTIVQKQNDGALTEGQRRLAVSVLMCLLTWPVGCHMHQHPRSYLSFKLISILLDTSLR